MHEIINKIKRWCEENEFCESNSKGTNNNFYYIHKDGNIEQIDVYWGTTDKVLNIKYNLCFELNTHTNTVLYQLIDLSDDAYDNQYGDSMNFVHNDCIRSESCVLDDLEDTIQSLRTYINKMFNLTTFPILLEN